MEIPYRAFNCKFIMYYIILIFSFFVTTNNVFAYNSLFVVEGVEVDITSENSVIAQEKALDEAQRKAFQILANRMVEEAQVSNVSTPDSLTLSSLVKDYEVTNEQLSSVRYVATYTFRFRNAAVSKFFSVSGVKFTDKSSKTLLVIPVFQTSGKNLLWSEGNIWLQAWSNARLYRGLVPVEVPIGDLMDMADIDEDKALGYKRKNLDRMLARYNAKEAAIMIAVPDIDLLDGGDLRISIYRTNRMRAQHVRDVIITANGNETVEQLYARAVKQSYAVLQKDWKDKTLSSSLEDRSFIVRVPLQNLTQWEQVKQALISLGGVSDLSIISLKKIEARLSFIFRGNEAHLREALSRSHLYLGQGYANANNTNPSVIYDLTFGRKSGKKKSKSNNFYQGIEPAATRIDNNSSHYTF